MLTLEESKSFELHTFLSDLCRRISTFTFIFRSIFCINYSYVYKKKALRLAKRMLDLEKIISQMSSKTPYQSVMTHLIQSFIYFGSFV